MSVLIDIRDLDPEALPKLGQGSTRDNRYLVTAWQWRAWREHGERLPDERLVVVVPDFLYYARLASTGQAKRIAELPKSLSAVTLSCVQCIPTGLRNLRGLAKGEFWAGAEALLSFDLGLLAGFKGEVVLHSNLADFVWVFEKEDFVRRYVKLCGESRKVGYASQQIEKAVSACARWQIDSNRFIYPIPFNENARTSMVERAKRLSFPASIWTVDLTQWPVELVAGILKMETPESDQGDYLISRTCAEEIFRSV